MRQFIADIGNAYASIVEVDDAFNAVDNRRYDALVGLPGNLGTPDDASPNFRIRFRQHALSARNGSKEKRSEARSPRFGPGVSRTKLEIVSAFERKACRRADVAF